MQNKVKNFNTNNKPLSASIRALDIASETGEFVKEVIKCQNYGEQNFHTSDDLELELGDMLYSILSFANEHNINAEECLDKVIAKYTKRLTDKGHLGSN